MSNLKYNEYLIIMQTPTYRLSKQTFTLPYRSKRSNALAIARKSAHSLRYILLGVYKLGPNLMDKL